MTPWKLWKLRAADWLRSLADRADPPARPVTSGDLPVAGRPVFDRLVRMTGNCTYDLAIEPGTEPHDVMAIALLMASMSALGQKNTYGVDHSLYKLDVEWKIRLAPLPGPLPDIPVWSGQVLRALMTRARRAEGTNVPCCLTCGAPIVRETP